MKDLAQIQGNLQKLIDPTAFQKFAKGAEMPIEVISKVLSGLTEYSELVTRFATYVTARQMGKTAFDATTMAKNVSVNFNKRGEWGRSLSTIYAFFNASIQGVVKALGLTISQWKKILPLCVMFIVNGFIDTFRYLYPDKQDVYTWWTYIGDARSRNVGWRLDYFVVSESLKDKVIDSYIYSNYYGSDHCPVGLEIKN